MLDALPLVAVTALVALTTLALKRRSGVARAADTVLSAAQRRDLGMEEPGPALLLFTAPGCASCAPARRVLQEVAEPAGLPVVTVDVSRHGALASSQRVFRSPTTFVLDDRGRTLARISGVPRHDELRDLLALSAA